MKVKLLAGIAVFGALSLTGYAQSATGMWKGEFEIPGGRGGGPQMITLVLNADGTGTFKQGEAAEPETLSEVMIDGSMVSFKRTPNFGGRGGAGAGGGFTLTYSGEVDGDTLTLETSFEGGGFGGGGAGGGGFEIPPLVLTRAED
jgi:hypothetical protein